MSADRELVLDIARGGDLARRAEAELCRRFAPRLRIYGIRNLRDDERTHDLVQTVLLGVLVAARAGRIDEPDKLAHFVLATARNVATRIRASEARLVPDDTLELEYEDLPLIDMRPLMTCLDRLDERGRAVMHLTFHLEHPADAIAKKLGTTAGNVRVMRHRALVALRACLDGAQP